ncbi:polyketide synthase (beta-ketoacyl synthase) [Seiridium cupressi]
MEALPSLLIFGPLAAWPTGDYLRGIRNVLARQKHLTPVIEALRQLPELWSTMVAQDQALSAAPGIAGARRLAEWATIDTSLGGAADEIDFFEGEEMQNSNALAMPLTIAGHLCQYMAYMEHANHQHSTLLKTAEQTGGIQGLCAGLLSAVAVAGATDEVELGTKGALAVRLAFAIGAYVDLDAFTSGETCCLAARCKAPQTLEGVERIVESHSQTYLSIIKDTLDTSITVPKSLYSTVARELASENVTVLTTSISGRYHTPAHEGTIRNIINACETHGHIDFGRQGIVRSNTNGQVITDDDVVSVLLRCILVDRCDWRSVTQPISSSLENADGRPIILSIGADAIPSSMAKNYSVIKGAPLLQNRYPHDAIAIIGMSCKLPGADSVDEFWQLLLDGKSMLESVPPGRFGEATTSYNRGGPATKNRKFWGNFMRDVDAFDHRFFKKSSREAASMDPQQRLLLHAAYEAMESSGYFADPARPRDVGCYLGLCAVDYDSNVASHPPNAFSTLGTLRAFLSGKLSHFFGWSGPSLTFDTACSSSAVAIHTACQALRAGECSQAVAGGVSLFTTPYLYENLAAAHFLSPTGATKPFDVKADGYCRGEGLGLVVLKRLSSAVKNGDDILGVIAGSAINQNDNCVPIMVPHAPSQSTLYDRVIRQAGIRPLDLSFVEAHGTGTPVGDPIEMDSIRSVFGGPKRRNPLFVSSVKGNIGHLEGAAGVASLIKAVLQMENRTACLQASFSSLNPKIAHVDKDHIVVPTRSQSLPSGLLTAMINNYGAAGSNATMILMEPPQRKGTVSESKLCKYPILVTANSIESLRLYCQELVTYCRGKAVKLPSLAYNLARRQNQNLPYALFTTASSVQDMQDQLLRPGMDVEERPKTPPLVLLFGGQTKSHVGLSKQAWQDSALLRFYLDACDGILCSMGYPSIYPEIFQLAPICDTVVLHSAVFALQYASAMSWLDSGFTIDAVIGHSLGQLTALCVSGALPLQDGLKLVAGRASLMQQYWGSEPGSMLLVEADAETLSSIPHSVEVACYNGPSSHVIVGDEAQVEAFEAELSKRNLRFKRLAVTNGFHSRFTEPLIPHLEQLASSLCFTDPSIRLETCSAGQSWPKPTARLVALHTREPVYFEQAVRRLASSLGPSTWLEAGSDSGVTAMARRALDSTDNSGHAFHGVKLSQPAALDLVVDTTVHLWKRGHKGNFWNFHRFQRRDYSFMRLPSYRFETNKHWLPLLAPRVVTELDASASPQTDHPATLITLVESNAQGVARFRANTQAESYQKLVSGHIVAGHPLCPATLYMEMAARAALILVPAMQNDSNPQFSFHGLDIGSPLGLANDRVVIVELEPLNKTPLSSSWKYAVTSRVGNTDTSHDRTPASPVLHASGTVCLQGPGEDHATAQREFERFERLITIDTIKSLFQNFGCESIRGAMLYKAFGRVVEYAGCYRGVKGVAAMDSRIAGMVEMPAEARESYLTTALTQPPLLDSFMQVGGVHANNIYPCAEGDVYVFTKLDRLRLGPGFAAKSNSWKIFGNVTTAETNAKELSYDIFVFDHTTGRLVVLIAGARFTQVRLGSLSKVLSKVNSQSVLGSSGEVAAPGPEIQAQPKASPHQRSAKVVKKTSDDGHTAVFDGICAVVEKVAEVPRSQIKGDISLEDAGIDSLMMMEIISELGSHFGMEFPMEDFLEMQDVNALVKYLLGKGCGPDAVALSLADDDSTSGDSDSTSDLTSDVKETPDSLESGDLPLRLTGVVHEHPDLPSPLEQDASMTSLEALFDNVRFNFDEISKEEKFADFWTAVYPGQSRLVNAYVAEAFDQLGVHLNSLSEGQPLAELPVLPKYQHLVRRMHEILADGGYIEPSGDATYTRSSRLYDLPSSQTLLSELSRDFPQHLAEHRLLNVTGSRLAQCMTGKLDPLQILFGNKTNRQLMADVYTNAPMCRVGTRLVASYLGQIFACARKGEAFHILEVGGGTGGTTSMLVEHLTQLGVPFTYTFTDISPALVTAAKKTFSKYDSMRYMVFDVEQTVNPALLGKYHAVVSTNCIHATGHATSALANLRTALRADGVVVLVEFTRGLYWFDLVYGLLDGWWLFRDGRRHALADESFWDPSLRQAGFRQTAWSDGSTHEAQILRVICGFNGPQEGEGFFGGESETPVLESRSGVQMETVVWKHADGLKLHADIYYPHEAERTEKRPIALLIHGGGHVVFSRKDIAMKHIRILLKRGFLPVSIDYRLCPETTLQAGPVTDAIDALKWVREELPFLQRAGPAISMDHTAVAVIGWSSGGHLAMTLPSSAKIRGVKAPEVIMAFYCPSNLEAEWWRKPIYPKCVLEQPGTKYDLLDGVCQTPISSYTPDSRSGPGLAMTLQDARWRIVIHMNWKAQLVPILVSGLPSKRKAALEDGTSSGWDDLPMPPTADVQAVSPYAQIVQGNYRTPTFIVHGRRDDLIPWQQSHDTICALKSRGVPAGIEVPDQAGHAFDLFPAEDQGGSGWSAVNTAYDFVCRHVGSDQINGTTPRGD